MSFVIIVHVQITKTVLVVITIIIIMVIFKCYFSGELIALSVLVVSVLANLLIAQWLLLLARLINCQVEVFRGLGRRSP